MGGGVTWAFVSQAAFLAPPCSGRELAGGNVAKFFHLKPILARRLFQDCTNLKLSVITLCHLPRGRAGYLRSVIADWYGSVFSNPVPRMQSGHGSFSA